MGLLSLTEKAQSIGATRRHAVQEPDGRRALPLRIHQPGHASTAKVHAVTALVRRRSEAAERQSRPLPQARHARGLIAKIPRTRRWRVTNYSRKVMGTSVYLREHNFPNVHTGFMH
jgi:hypothetical protein